MGEVYLAYDEKLDRKVALKILPSEFLTNDERVRRFELENSEAVASWLPDSRRVVYADGTAVYMIDAATKVRTKLVENPDVDIRSPFVSRDGKLLYYTASKAQSDIWLLDLSAEH